MTIVSRLVRLANQQRQHNNHLPTIYEHLLYRNLSSSSNKPPRGPKGSSLSGGESHKVPSFRMSATSSQVVHDKTGARFTLDLGNNQKARIEYKPIGNNKIEMYHTEVPTKLRGKGIGKVLAKGAIEEAARNNMQIKLTCSYLIDYINKDGDTKTKKMVDK